MSSISIELFEANPYLQGMRQHEAGYDAFLAGEVFLRLAHLYSMIHYRYVHYEASG